MQNVAECLVSDLEKRGVSHIFGLCGHTNIAVLAALEHSSIRFISTTHEQIAAHMADGYARSSHQVGVVLTHVGPGLTNAATAVATAALDSTPLLVLSGDIPSHFYGKNPHQEINLHHDASQHEIFRPFVKRTWRVEKPEQLPAILSKAYQLAQSGKPGPVLISVPMDIFSAPMSEDLFATHHTPGLPPAKPSLSTSTAQEILTTLKAAKKPLLFAGGGVIAAQATNELKALAEHLNIPVVHSAMGKGSLPDDHPLSAGLTGFWAPPFVNAMCLEADVIFALGTRFKEADSSSWKEGVTFDFSKTKLIQIDIDSQELGRNHPVHIGAVADMKESLKQIVELANNQPSEFDHSHREITFIAHEKERFYEENTEHLMSNDFPMRPQRILAEVRHCLPKDGFITTDVGWNKNGVGQQFPIYTPGTVLTPGGFATMGFGSPAALGIKIAHPERVVVSLVGDGGFGQNPSCLATAVQENIPIIWIVMNNQSYGVIAGLQKAHFNTTHGTMFEKNGEPYSPDFVALANSYGVEGCKIQSAEDFKPALAEAIAKQVPFLIDVATMNIPTPTSGHWDIMDIYSPGEKKSHSAL
ncbi:MULTISPECIES: thiamine pyrophosphate-binding protein [unclassified Shouchella]|uniref:thiamine pyrophosphate-binding protein n=1 Tax=unclassified Shouchella TaxID=2893065 RepID=UPI0039A2D12E